MRKKLFKQTGASLVEFVVAFPILSLLGLGAYQWTHIYEIQSTLNHATFMAARAGSVYNGDMEAMRGALAEYMTPLYAPESASTVHIQEKMGLRQGLVVTRNAGIATCNRSPHSDQFRDTTCHDVTEHARIRILNPTVEAFDDFEEDVNEDGTAEEIPNTDLNLRSSDIGASSGINVQDANILKIEITYMPRLNVPFVNRIFSYMVQAFSEPGSFEDINISLDNTRFPFRASATVRMQSPAVRHDELLTREQAEGLVDDLLASNPLRDDFTDRPWCGPTGDLCDVFVSPCDS